MKIERERQEAPQPKEASHDLKPWIALASLICAGAITTALLKRYRHIPHPPIAASAVIAGAAGLAALGLIYRSRQQPQVAHNQTTTTERVSQQVPIEETFDDVELRSQLRSLFPELETADPNWMRGTWADVQATLIGLCATDNEQVRVAADGALATIRQHRPHAVAGTRPVTGASASQERAEKVAADRETDQPRELSKFEAAVVHMKAMVDRWGVEEWIWTATSDYQLRDALEDALMVELKPGTARKLEEALIYLNQQFPYDPHTCARQAARDLARVAQLANPIDRAISINPEADDATVFRQMLRVASQDAGFAGVWGLTDHVARIAINHARHGVRHMIRVLPTAAKAVTDERGSLDYQAWVASLRRAGILSPATPSQLSTQ
jgi:hypothetical protein